MKQCQCFPVKHHGQPNNRKAVNSSGRLGSFYDSKQSLFTEIVSYDAEQIKSIGQVHCQTFHGKANRTLQAYMTLFGFQGTDIEHFHLQECELTGVASSVRFPRIINDSTRFLHYVYRHRQTKLKVKVNQFHRKHPLSSNEFPATDVVTKIIWGIEFLFILDITSTQSIDDVDRILRNLQQSLVDIERPWSFELEDRHQLALFTRATIYGNENCLQGRQWSMFDVIEQLTKWRTNESLHQPIEYICQPVSVLYPGQFRPQHKTKDFLKQIERRLERIGESIAQLKTIESSPSMVKQYDLIQQRYAQLLDRQQNFKEDCDRIRSDIEKKRSSFSALDQLLLDERYRSLQIQYIDQYQNDVEEFQKKTDFVLRMIENGFNYVDIVDVCSHMTDDKLSIDNVYDEVMRRYPSIEIFIYGTDSLRLTKSNEFRELCDRLIVEKAKETTIHILYIDLTGCHCQYDNFKVIYQRQSSE